MNDMKKNQMKVLAVVCALLALVGMGTAIYAGFGSTVTAEGNKGLISSWSTKFNDTTSSEETSNTGVISMGDAIAPGSTATGLIGFKEGDSITSNENGMNRLIMPDEVATLAKLLVSDAGKMIDGEVVHISGGRGTFDIR